MARGFGGRQWRHRGGVSKVAPAWRMRPVPAGTTLLMNATQLGCAPELEDVPLAWDTLDPACVVVDVITNPRITPFLATARQRGCPLVDGVEMVGAAGDADLRAVDRRDPGGGGVSAGGGAGAGGDVGGRADPQLFSVPPRSRQPGASLCAVVVADGGTKATGVVVRSPCPFPALPCRNRPRLPALLQGAATRRRVRQTHSSRNSPGPGWIPLAASRPSLA